ESAGARCSKLRNRTRRGDGQSAVGPFPIEERGRAGAPDRLEQIDRFIEWNCLGKNRVRMIHRHTISLSVSGDQLHGAAEKAALIEIAKARVGEHRHQARLVGQVTHGGRQPGVCVAIDEPAHERHELVKVDAMPGAEDGRGGSVHFEQRDLSAGLQDAETFAKRVFQIREITERKARHDRVEGSSTQGQAEGVGADQGGTRGSAFHSRHTQHLAGEIQAHDADANPCEIGTEVPAATGQIERARIPRQRQRLDRVPAPAPVHAERHEAIHEIVAWGNLVEHRLDHGSLGARFGFIHRGASRSLTSPAVRCATRKACLSPLCLIRASARPTSKRWKCWATSETTIGSISRNASATASTPSPSLRRPRTYALKRSIASSTVCAVARWCLTATSSRRVMGKPYSSKRMTPRAASRSTSE